MPDNPKACFFIALTLPQGPGFSRGRYQIPPLVALVPALQKPGTQARALRYRDGTGEEGDEADSGNNWTQEAKEGRGRPGRVTVWRSRSWLLRQANEGTGKAPSRR